MVCNCIAYSTHRFQFPILFKTFYDSWRILLKVCLTYPIFIELHTRNVNYWIEPVSTLVTTTEHQEGFLRIKNFWIALGMINTWVPVIRSHSARSQSQALWLAFVWLLSVRQKLLMWVKLKWSHFYLPTKIQTVLLVAVHQSGLKLNLRSRMLAQGVTSPEGKLAKSRKPPKPWHDTLCHLP